MAAELLELALSTKYPLDAFIFVQRGLDFTVRRIHGEPAADDKDKESDDDRPSRHVTGRQLCEGLRDFAVEQYGLLARTMLRRWRINTCEDFGRVVFAMVEHGLMKKTDEDTLDDFRNVFDFADAFAATLDLRAKSRRVEKV